jgi:hypothetical protein
MNPANPFDLLVLLSYTGTGRSSSLGFESRMRYQALLLKTSISRLGMTDDQDQMIYLLDVDLPWFHDVVQSEARLPPGAARRRPTSSPPIAV